MNSIKFSKQVLSLFIIPTILITIFISGCSKNEKNVIKKDTFVKILAELIIIESLNATEQEKSELMKNVFKTYNTDQEKFEETRLKYKKDPQYWIDVYRDVKDLISAEADSLARTKQKHQVD